MPPSSDSDPRFLIPIRSLHHEVVYHCVFPQDYIFPWMRFNGLQELRAYMHAPRTKPNGDGHTCRRQLASPRFKRNGELPVYEVRSRNVPSADRVYEFLFEVSNASDRPRQNAIMFGDRRL
jgi:hypothetical protein